MIENIKFVGVEADLKVSLVEYGFIIGKVSDYYIVVYELLGQFFIKKMFDFEFEELFEEHREEIAKNIGINVTEWDEIDIQHKISDLIFALDAYELFGYSRVAYDKDNILTMLNL